MIHKLFGKAVTRKVNGRGRRSEKTSFYNGPRKEDKDELSSSMRKPHFLPDAGKLTGSDVELCNFVWQRPSHQLRLSIM